MLELTSDNFSESVNDNLIVIDFWAEWCGPCKTLAPAFAEVAASMGREAVFAKVDIDAHAGLAQTYSVLSIPTILVLKDGVEIGRLVGSRSARQLAEELTALLG